MTEPLDRLLAREAELDLEHARAEQVVEAVSAMVAHPDYPCLGARSVFRRSTARIVVLDDLTETTRGGALDRLGIALRQFAENTDPAGEFASLVACFRGPASSSEQEFESLLWGALQHLHDRDDTPWADGVAADPADPHFAFSVAGCAFFVVGLHPGASRVARRAPVPTLVFNLHEQFERLRGEGRYDRMRDVIRRRDTDLQGCPNPMALDHGLSSEARQYAGRAVPPTWSAPFDPHPREE